MLILQTNKVMYLPLSHSLFLSSFHPSHMSEMVRKKYVAKEVISFNSSKLLRK